MVVPKLPEFPPVATLVQLPPVSVDPLELELELLLEELLELELELLLEELLELLLDELLEESLGVLESIKPPLPS